MRRSGKTYIKYKKPNGDIEEALIKNEQHYQGQVVGVYSGTYSLFDSREIFEKYKADVKAFNAKMDSRTGTTTSAYAILGLDKGASQEDIKAAYQTMRSLHHPDKGGNTERMKRINVAYDCLKSLPIQLPKDSLWTDVGTA